MARREVPAALAGKLMTQFRFPCLYSRHMILMWQFGIYGHDKIATE
jgi:hypothetical protein